MTKNLKLLLSCGSVALLGVLVLPGCGSSSSDAAGAAGKASTGGTSSNAGSGGRPTSGNAGRGSSSAAGTSSSAGEGGEAGSETSAGGEAGDGTSAGGGGATSTGGTSSTGGGGAGGKASTGGSGGVVGGSGGASFASGGAAGSDQNAICAKFCADEATICVGGLQQYASTVDCTTACAAFARGTVGATSGDSLDCRVYHLSVAGKNAGNATTHCPHTTAVPANGTPCTGAAQ